jgi:hypothetical protein
MFSCNVLSCQELLNINFPLLINGISVYLYYLVPKAHYKKTSDGCGTQVPVVIGNLRHKHQKFKKTSKDPNVKFPVLLYDPHVICPKCYKFHCFYFLPFVPKDLCPGVIKSKRHKAQCLKEPMQLCPIMVNGINVHSSFVPSYLF